VNFLSSVWSKVWRKVPIITACYTHKKYQNENWLSQHFILLLLIKFTFTYLFQSEFHNSVFTVTPVWLWEIVYCHLLINIWSILWFYWFAAKSKVLYLIQICPIESVHHTETCHCQDSKITLLRHMMSSCKISLRSTNSY
jgi:hypothetical protein